MTFSLFLTSDADPGAKGRLDGHAGDVHDIAHIGAAPGHFGSVRGVVEATTRGRPKPMEF